MGATAVNYYNHTQFFDFVKEKEKRTNNNNVEEQVDAGSKDGGSKEVYAFRKEEEIASMIKILDKHIEEAERDVQRQIAWRNKLLFVIGINVGLRASDLRRLKWSFFIDTDKLGQRYFKEKYTMFAKKQRKYVDMYFNEVVYKVVENFLKLYPVENLDSYLFASRKGNEPICESSLWRIIKDTAEEAGIKQNIGSHSLRKTFGYWTYKKNPNSVAVLQKIFNHSSESITLCYIGITDEKVKETFDNLNLGLEYL